MNKINLHIIYKDYHYVNNLAEYIISNHSRIFQVNSYTEESRIPAIFSGETREEDVYLICPEIYTGLRLKEKPGLFILLINNDDLFPAVTWKINRYQLGDVIVNSIIKIYSEYKNTQNTLPAGKEKTRVISLFSPAGGTGKTTVAVGASIQSAWEGKNTFYLNLEDIPSTSLYFQSRTGGGLSQALFYIQERSKNAAIKINGLKCIDLHYKVHYFSPQDSALDITKEGGNHLARLIGELKNSGQYDRIFIDMSAGINENTIEILNASDLILLITTQDLISQEKLKMACREQAFQRETKGKSIMEKSEIIINKSKEDGGGDYKVEELNGKGVLIKIPKVADLAITQGDRIRLDMNGPFGTAIHKLIGEL